MIGIDERLTETCDEPVQLGGVRDQPDRYRPRGRTRSEAGFTIIEMLIVVALLAILVATAIIGIGQLRKNALVQVCAEDRSTIETAAQASSSIKSLGYFEPISVLASEGFLKNRGNVGSAFEDPDPSTGVVEVNPTGKYGSVKAECEAKPGVNG